MVSTLFRSVPLDGWTGQAVPGGLCAAAAAAEWTLLTRVEAVSAAGGYLSVPGLRSLMKAGVKLFHADRLHAEVFLARIFHDLPVAACWRRGATASG